MYAIRVLIGGNIFIIRASDKVSARYKADGVPVNGNLNKLQLEPYQVILLAEESESEWFNSHLND